MEETETTFEIYILKIFKMQKCMHGNKKLKCTNFYNIQRAKMPTVKIALALAD